MINFSRISGLELAYLGDAVMELFVREHLLESGVCGTWALNHEALSYVKATAQSAALENILPHLTEEEMRDYKNARNCHTAAVPKSATVCQYRRATGLEALFAWLWLNDKKDRAKDLFYRAYRIGDYKNEPIIEEKDDEPTA